MTLGRTSTIAVCLAATLSVLTAATGRTQLYHSPVPLVPVSLAKDPHGLIWIAARQGVFRFDGLHYHSIPGYPFQGVRFITVAPSGDVWAGGPQGLARLSGSDWKVIGREPVLGMAMSPAGLWVNEDGLRFHGSVEKRFPNIKPTGELVVGHEGSVWFPCATNICSISPGDWRVESQTNPAPGSWQRVVPEKGFSRYWLSTEDEVALVDSGRLKAREHAPFGRDFEGFAPPLDPSLSPAGTVWGMRAYPHRLPGLPVWRTPPAIGECALIADETTLWFCAGDQLGKSQQTPDWETWTSVPFTSRAPEGFVSRQGKVPLLYTDRGVVELNADTREWRSTAGSYKFAVMNMIEDGHGGYWLATRDEGLLRMGKDFAVRERFPAICSSPDAMRGLLRDGRGRIWVGGKDANCFFEVQGSPGHWKFVPQALPGGTAQTVDLRSDRQGRPWVGYNQGIAYLDGSGRWVRLTTSESLTLIRAFDFDGDDAIWVAHRRPGFFTRLTRRGSTWQVHRFSGGTSDAAQTEYVRRDSRGLIWRGTLTDVEVARPGRYEPGDWISLRRRTGTAVSGTSLRGWSEDDSGSVWIASGTGVTRVRPSPEWFNAPIGKQPLVTRLRSEGQTWLNPDHLPNALSGSNGPLEIDLSAVDANPFERSPLEYRLLPVSQDWKPVPDGRLQFKDLASGSFTLEARYTGDGTPGSLRYAFQVGTPLSQPLMLTVALGALGLLIAQGWHRREWLLYRIRKSVFMLGRRIHRDDVDVSWTSYTGETLRHRYEISHTLSRGVFSVTYLAHDRQTGAKVVVKVLRPTQGQERWMRHRFAHEVAAMHTLSHPGVVELLDSWIGPEGEPFMVMPYLRGPTLRQLLTEQHRVDPWRAAAILEQLGAAVAAIHEHGIVHRDLKPENIIVVASGTPDERVVVIDFGTSAVRGPEKDLENTVTLTGSLHYLAPERLGGQYSPASDVYSLGVIVLEMLCGKRPAEMDVAPTEAEFINVVGKSSGDAAARKIAAALQHQPGRRPADVSSWTTDLAELLRTFSGNSRAGAPSS